jgi:cyclic beta-1,2-glucan synthetase
VSYRPRLAARFRRFLANHATATYLGAIAAVTGLLVAGALRYAVAHEAGPLGLVSMALLLLLPASELAIAIVQRLVALAIPPERLPRLELADGVPPDARTFVVIPALVTSVSAAEDLLAHIQVLALGNGDPNIHFGILSDFIDAPRQVMPEDEAVLATLQDGIDALNITAGHERGDAFHLFHRVRQWNATEGCWMGWERKRGKLEEFNRLLRGATDTSFAVHVGDASVLDGRVRYCITLDSDT